MAEIEKLLEFARDITHEAGRLTLGYFDRTLEIIDKADGSPVTIADREAESYIRRAIESRFPDHGIYGEEHGVKEPAAGCSWTWYIDPIDGTKSFIHGVPLYSNLLAARCEDRTVIGIIGLPALGQQVSAAEGMGCTLNGRRVQVSRVSDISRAVFLTSSADYLETRAPGQGWRSIWKSCKFNRSWGDGYGYMLVASGRAEAMIDPIIEPYDVAPMPVILKEAGGHFFDWRGRDVIDGGAAVGCNAALKDEILKAVSEGLN